MTKQNERKGDDTRFLGNIKKLKGHTVLIYNMLKRHPTMINSHPIKVSGKSVCIEAIGVGRKGEITPNNDESK